MRAVLALLLALGAAGASRGDAPTTTTVAPPLGLCSFE